MRQRIIALLKFCIVLVFGLGLPVQAVVPVTKVASGLIVPDGVITGWPRELFADFGPTDAGNSWAISYDDIFLHLAVIVRDTTPEFSDTTSKTSLRNDAVQVYLHTDQAKLGWAVTCWGQTRQTVILPLFSDSIDTRWVIARLAPGPEGYTLELSIARSALGLANNQLKSFSLQLVILDLTNGLIRQVFTINNRLTEWQNPEHFLRFSLK